MLESSLPRVNCPRRIADPTGFPDRHSLRFVVLRRQTYKTAISPADYPVLVAEISLRFSAVSHSDSSFPRVLRHSLPTFEKPALVRLRFI